MGKILAAIVGFIVMIVIGLLAKEGARGAIDSGNGQVFMIGIFGFMAVIGIYNFVTSSKSEEDADKKNSEEDNNSKPNQ